MMAAPAAAAAANHLRDEALDRQAVEDLKRLLHLEKAPRRIEGFDISNTMGNQSVASMVVWEDGEMKKADYRRFKIQTVIGVNDFASMQEVVARRYGEAEHLARPDLVLIDGGLGQLAAAMEGLKQVGHGGQHHVRLRPGGRGVVEVDVAAHSTQEPIDGATQLV